MPSASTKPSRGLPARVQLRAYAPADFDQLYAIDQSCYDPRIAYSRTELRQYLGYPGADCVIAEAMQKHSAEAMPENSAEAAARHNAAPAIMGFCITAHKTSWGYIITMDVLSNYRRHGIGSMLLIEAERQLIASGVRQIGLETATNNSTAIAFWQKHGYRKSGIRKHYYPGGRDAYSMAKRLAGVQSVAKAGSQH